MAPFRISFSKLKPLLLGAAFSCDLWPSVVVTIYMYRLLFSALAIAFGVFMIVYGGYDDSPGAQALGLIAVIGGVVGIVSSRNRSVE